MAYNGGVDVIPADAPSGYPPPDLRQHFAEYDLAEPTLLVLRHLKQQPFAVAISHTQVLPVLRKHRTPVTIRPSVNAIERPAEYCPRLRTVPFNLGWAYDP